MKNKKTLVIILSVIVILLLMYWWYKIGFSYAKIVRYAALFYAMLYLSYIDIKERIVPGRILKWMILFRILVLAAEMFFYSDIRIELALSALGGFFMGGLLMLIAYLLSRKGIGAGDVKLIAVTGAYMGSSNIYAVIIVSLLIASFYGIIGMALKKIKLKDEVSFVPFVATACFIVMLLGM